MSHSLAHARARACGLLQISKKKVAGRAKQTLDKDKGEIGKMKHKMLAKKKEVGLPPAPCFAAIFDCFLPPSIAAALALIEMAACYDRIRYALSICGFARPHEWLASHVVHTHTHTHTRTRAYTQVPPCSLSLSLSLSLSFPLSLSLPPPLSPALALSLSHTHTRARAHAYIHACDANSTCVDIPTMLVLRGMQRAAACGVHEEC